MAETQQVRALSLRFLIAAVLAFAIWQCVTIAVAAGITRSVSLGFPDAAPTVASMKLAARRLNTAISIAPDYAPALYLMARVTTDVEKRLAIVRHITDIQPREVRAWGLLYQLALEHAPARPLADQAVLAIEQYGPWDPVSNHLIVEAGTRHWLSLNPLQRSAVLGAAHRSLSSDAIWLKVDTLTLIKQRGLLPIICSQQNSDNKMPGECRTTPD